MPRLGESEKEEWGGMSWRIYLGSVWKWNNLQKIMIE